MELTHDFQKAVVSYEKFVAVDDFDPDVEFFMLGKEGQPYVKETLIPTCGYVFRKTLKGGYVPKRVTIHPATAANIARASCRYGTQHILNEL